VRAAVTSAQAAREAVVILIGAGDARGQGRLPNDDQQARKHMAQHAGAACYKILLQHMRDAEPPFTNESPHLVPRTGYTPANSDS